MMYRLSQGLFYEGRPNGWVSTLSIGVIQEHVDKTLLPSLKIVEDSYMQLQSVA